MLIQAQKRLLPQQLKRRDQRGVFIIKAKN